MRAALLHLRFAPFSDYMQTTEMNVLSRAMIPMSS
jgi:hypothetical protein